MTNGFEKTGLSSEQINGVIEAARPSIPMKRFGESREVAATVWFPASDEASFIHGTEITVDGSLTGIKISSTFSTGR